MENAMMIIIMKGILKHLYKGPIKVTKKKAAVKAKYNLLKYNERFYAQTEISNRVLSFLFLIILFHFATRTHIRHSHFSRMFLTDFCG